MSDASLSSGASPTPAKKSLMAADARTRKRNAAEKRFRAYGIAAIVTGMFFLIVLAVSIVRSGLPAFSHTVVSVEFNLTEEQFADAESQLFKTKAYEALLIEEIRSALVARGLDVEFDSDAIARLLGKPGGTLREHYRANEQDLGQPVRFELAAASRVDGYLTGRVTRDTLQDSRFLQGSDLDLIDALVDADIITRAFNWNFITGADTGVDNPGGAGIGASVIGSFFMMLVVLVAVAANRRCRLDLP